MKTVSITNEPVIAYAVAGPRYVKTGKNALRKACFQTTVRRGNPLARAVRMKSLPSVSNIETRVSRAIYAIGISDSASDGSTMWRIPPTRRWGTNAATLRRLR